VESSFRRGTDGTMENNKNNTGNKSNLGNWQEGGQPN